VPRLRGAADGGGYDDDHTVSTPSKPSAAAVF
jgi:hypothetical protein